MTSPAGRHRARTAPRPGMARVWTGVSVLCATFGIAAVLPALLPAADPNWDPFAPRLATAPDVRLVAPPTADPMPASLPVELSIPVLSIRTEVVRLGLEADGEMEIPPGAAMAGWYEHGPTPGEIGPSVLAAHVDWSDQPGVFRNIDELETGDEVAVTREDGSVATFRVELVVNYAKSTFPSDAVYGDLDHAGLRLITCGGNFDEETGDYADNVVVYARLTD